MSEVFDIHRVMAELAAVRPIFHSEADFQHALAWQIRLLYPQSDVRLEVPAFRGSRGHLDLAIQSAGVWIPMELKYVPAGLTFTDRGGETFNLINSDARDLPRAGFAKDISRLESLVADRPGSHGWAILLSNMPAYWGTPGTADTSDAAYRLHEGRILSGSLAWRAGTAASTTKGTESFRLGGSYQCHWNDYSSLGPGRNQRFRYLAVEVQ